MHVPTRRYALLAGLAAASALAACGQPSHQPSSVETSNGVTAYLGVVPSAIVRAQHPDRVLHPSAPMGDTHIVVALYDAVSGARIENAAVEAVIQGERHRAAHRIRLEPMRIDGTLTYGGFVSLAHNDRYHIDVLIRPASSTQETRIQFLFDAQSLPRSAT